MAIMLIFTAGCQHQETLYTGDGREDVTALNTIQTKNSEDSDAEQELVNSLNDFYQSYRSLKIQKSGENTVYDAEKSLVYIFADMISKVEVVYPDTPEGKERIKNFNFDYYDYCLKFEGARDILFTR